LQFVDLDRGVPEIVRVLRTGGRAVLCHLAAYGEADRDEAFEIQRLRNPARVNFFMPGDLESRLEAYGLRVTRRIDYLSRESIGQWIDHGAIEDDRKRAIRACYRSASEDFKRIHHVEYVDDDVFDTMLMLIIGAERP
jgi:DNA gyrase subunit B